MANLVYVDNNAVLAKQYTVVTHPKAQLLIALQSFHDVCERQRVRRIVVHLRQDAIPLYNVDSSERLRCRSLINDPHFTVIAYR